MTLKEELRFVETTVMALCVMIGGDWRMLLSSVGNSASMVIVYHIIDIHVIT